MEIILNNIKFVDIIEKRNKVEWMELDFSIIHSLKGNKELLEQTFQDTKKELV
jgi:hypothetical protein